MCQNQKLNKERNQGKEAAKLLVEHLSNMRAEQCEIPVVVDGKNYVCECYPKGADRRKSEVSKELTWPIIDHGSTGNPDCCGCWVWTFNRTGYNYITITCNECGEVRVLLIKGNPNAPWISRKEVIDVCDNLLEQIAVLRDSVEIP